MRERSRVYLGIGVLTVYFLLTALDQAVGSEFSVNWPTVSLGADLRVDSESREAMLRGVFRLPFFEGDRELLDHHEESGWTLVRGEDQRLRLRRETKGSERLLSEKGRIYGRGSFSLDGTRLVSSGLNEDTYASLIDCYDVESGELIWSYEGKFAKSFFLRRSERILLTSYSIQDLEGVVAVQLLDAWSGAILSEIAWVARPPNNQYQLLSAEESGRYLFVYNYNMLHVDAKAGQLWWFNDDFDGAFLSPDGSSLGSIAPSFGDKPKVVGLRPGAPSYDFSDFVGFNGPSFGGVGCFSGDNRSLYVVTRVGRVEMWDLASGTVKRVFSNAGTKFSHLYATRDGRRLLVLGLDNENTHRFLEFDTSDSSVISERSWPLLAHTAMNEFGTVTSIFSAELEIPEDESRIRINMGSDVWEKPWEGGIFRRAVNPDRRVLAAVYIGHLDVFRVVWEGGSVVEFDPETLAQTRTPWSNSILSFANHVMIDPLSGDVGAEILSNLYILDGDTGELLRSAGPFNHNYSLSDLRAEGTRAICAKKVGGDIARGVYNLISETFILRFDALGKYTQRPTLSPRGDMLGRVASEVNSPNDKSLEVYRVDDSTLLASATINGNGGVSAFSPDGERIVFSTIGASGAWELWSLDIVTEAVVLVSDLSKMGSLARPSEIRFIGDENAVLVRTAYDALYIVDGETGVYSPIKYMRLGSITKSSRSLESQLIDVCAKGYLMFDGEGRLEMGKLGRSDALSASLSLREDDILAWEMEETENSLYRIIRSEDGVVWIDNGVPGELSDVDPEDMSRYPLMRVVESSRP